MAVAPRLRWALLAPALLLGACAHTPPDDPSDPLESINRPIYKFNEKADEYVARPVAKAYVKVVPQFVRTGVHNFFTNITYPTVIVNGLLQAKFKQSAYDTGRFLLNTVAGFAGVVDTAGLLGMEAHNEDFGQTLGYWGVGQGWYIMLPFLGPTTNRDGIGQIADAYSNPLSYADEDYTWPLYGLSFVDSRAGLLGTEGVLEQQFDRYAFIRGAYLQRRLYLTYDGNPPQEALYGDIEEE